MAAPVNPLAAGSERLDLLSLHGPNGNDERFAITPATTRLPCGSRSGDSITRYSVIAVKCQQVVADPTRYHFRLKHRDAQDRSSTSKVAAHAWLTRSSLNRV